ncbi:tRNA preQ1(34) S-adenosylmethionine ribosyltransferase-isomerase QueA [Nibricoccus sp. IMCC34717]|uniref:tRNA preQ1(34) S-adenosylmethionine ribosyltransferase-isomerase QueA n=1 Tax=Nibricoccus sp. IMCC34717 TaxID=3034021 RepID=UPI00384F6565
MAAVPLSTDLFDYDLPERLIAQTPAIRRDESRLLVVDRKTGTWEHRRFAAIGDYLGKGDVVFRNNAAVLPARLLAKRPTGGAVECFLLRPAPEHGENQWWCLVRPGKKLPVGAVFARDGAFEATVEARDGDGGARVRFSCAGGETITAVANRIGEVPLPPYIAREAADGKRGVDLERYQTVYADRTRQVAVAAPTAGLHFTPELLETLAGQGVEFRDLCLHVGLGTFRPISSETIEGHVIHREVYELPRATQEAVLAPAGRRRVAVGTTSVRSLEDFCSKRTEPAAGPWFDEASIYLYPPRHYKAVDALVTNFHQPRSTLLCLVASFLTPGSLDGIALLKAVYADAVRNEYRFLSYGDAMLVV